MRARVLILPLSLLACSAGCHRKEKTEQAEKAEEAKVEARAQELAAKMAVDIDNERRAEETVRRVEQMRSELQRLHTAPDEFFEASALRLMTRGAPDRPVRSVQEVTVTNKSKFAVLQINARVDFVENGTPVASIPIILRGALPAGGTRRYAVGEDTLEGAAVQTATTDTKFAVVSVVEDEPPRVATP
jgi:hypothetical protein